MSGHSGPIGRPSDGDAEEAAVTTGALARHMGVSPTTLRTWDRRYGVGPEDRGDGRHRRWAPRDIALLEDMCGLTAAGVPPAEAARVAKRRAADPAAARKPRARGTAPRAEGVRPTDVSQETRGLIRASMRLDSPAIEERLTELVRRNGVVFTWEQVMVPALRAVGRRWELSDDGYVEVEHLLAWHVSGTLRAVAALGAHAHRESAPALLSCLPGEQHTLPMEALDAALSERAVPRRTLGGSVPADALLRAVRRVGPAAVVLWSQTHSTADPRLARRIAATRWGVRGARRSPMVLLAGPGWGRAHDLTDMVRPHDLRHALSIVEQLVLTSAVSTTAR